MDANGILGAGFLIALAVILGGLVGWIARSVFLWGWGPTIAAVVGVLFLMVALLLGIVFWALSQSGIGS